MSPKLSNVFDLPNSYIPFDSIDFDDGAYGLKPPKNRVLEILGLLLDNEISSPDSWSREESKFLFFNIQGSNSSEKQDVLTQRRNRAAKFVKYLNEIKPFESVTMQSSKIRFNVESIDILKQQLSEASQRSDIKSIQNPRNVLNFLNDISTVDLGRLTNGKVFVFENYSRPTSFSVTDGAVNNINKAMWALGLNFEMSATVGTSTLRFPLVAVLDPKLYKKRLSQAKAILWHMSTHLFREHPFNHSEATAISSLRGLFEDLILQEGLFTLSPENELVFKACIGESADIIDNDKLLSRKLNLSHFIQAANEAFIFCEWVDDTKAALVFRGINSVEELANRVDACLSRPLIDSDNKRQMDHLFGDFQKLVMSSQYQYGQSLVVDIKPGDGLHRKIYKIPNQIPRFINIMSAWGIDIFIKESNDNISIQLPLIALTQKYNFDQRMDNIGRQLKIMTISNDHVPKLNPLFSVYPLVENVEQPTVEIDESQSQNSPVTHIPSNGSIFDHDNHSFADPDTMLKRAFQDILDSRLFNDEAWFKYSPGKDVFHLALDITQTPSGKITDPIQLDIRRDMLQKFINSVDSAMMGRPWSDRISIISTNQREKTKIAFLNVNTKNQLEAKIKDLFPGFTLNTNVPQSDVIEDIFDRDFFKVPYAGDSISEVFDNLLDPKIFKDDAWTFHRGEHPCCIININHPSVISLDNPRRTVTRDTELKKFHDGLKSYDWSSIDYRMFFTNNVLHLGNGMLLFLGVDSKKSLSKHIKRAFPKPDVSTIENPGLVLDVIHALVDGLDISSPLNYACVDILPESTLYQLVSDRGTAKIFEEASLAFGLYLSVDFNDEDPENLKLEMNLPVIAVTDQQLFQQQLRDMKFELMKVDSKENKKSFFFISCSKEVFFRKFSKLVVRSSRSDEDRTEIAQNLVEALNDGVDVVADHRFASVTVVRHSRLDELLRNPVAIEIFNEAVSIIENESEIKTTLFPVSCVFDHDFFENYESEESLRETFDDILNEAIFPVQNNFWMELNTPVGPRLILDITRDNRGNKIASGQLVYRQIQVQSFIESLNRIDISSPQSIQCSWNDPDKSALAFIDCSSREALKRKVNEMFPKFDKNLVVKPHEILDILNALDDGLEPHEGYICADVKTDSTLHQLITRPGAADRFNEAAEAWGLNFYIDENDLYVYFPVIATTDHQGYLLRIDTMKSELSAIDASLTRQINEKEQLSLKSLQGNTAATENPSHHAYLMEKEQSLEQKFHFFNPPKNEKTVPNLK